MRKELAFKLHSLSCFPVEHDFLNYREFLLRSNYICLREFLDKRFLWVALFLLGGVWLNFDALRKVGRVVFLLIDCLRVFFNDVEEVLASNCCHIAFVVFARISLLLLLFSADLCVDFVLSKDRQDLGLTHERVADVEVVNHSVILRFVTRVTFVLLVLVVF